MSATLPLYIVLLGAPGAGKGTQARLLTERMGIPQVASGDLFREHLSRETPLGGLAKGYMERGELVPDDVTIQMVQERLARPDAARGAVLDGFPRTIPQAEALARVLQQMGHRIACVPYIEVSDRELLARLSGRWICPVCQTTYHVVNSPPKVAGICDKDGATLYQRPDDTEETARNRLQVYFQQTAPLIEYYRGKGLLVKIDGEQSIESVQAALFDAITERMGRIGLVMPGHARVRRQEAHIYLKTSAELALMREAGRIVAVTLERLREHVRPGVTTAELDAIAETTIRSHGAIPAFKGYRGFPASLCASINQELVHGIPSPDRALADGDIISLDVGAIHKGWFGDSAITVAVGEASPVAQRLMAATEGALYAGIAQARPGNRLRDISAAIQAHVESRGFAVVREYTGHGIGRAMHEPPEIINFVPEHHLDAGPWLQPGMTLALEPMVQVGTWRTRALADGWTVVAADGSLAAHFEHTIAIADGNAEILTSL